MTGAGRGLAFTASSCVRACVTGRWRLRTACAPQPRAPRPAARQQLPRHARAVVPRAQRQRQREQPQQQLQRHSEPVASENWPTESAGGAEDVTTTGAEPLEDSEDRVGDEAAYDDPVPNSIIEVAQRAADAARTVTRRWFRSPSLSVDTKADSSPVTVADREAERVMRKIILDALPGHIVLGEEDGGAMEEAADAEYAWVLDPIDGTKAFISGKPTFGTLVAVLRRGTPVFGIIDQPIADERWMGGIGWPTTLNGKPARVRETYPDAQSIEDAEKLLASCIVHATHPDMFIGLDAIMFRRLADKVKQVLYGSDCYAYALLASGYVDIVVEADLKLWDFAALAPVVQAAGGIMTDWDGTELDIFSDGRVIASPSHLLHSLVLGTLDDSTENPFNEDPEDTTRNDDGVLPSDPGPGHVESMTGYGIGEASSNEYQVTVQLRSVNSRYCEVQFRGPRFLAPYESELTSLVKRSLSRGRVVFSITISGSNSDSVDIMSDVDDVETAEDSSLHTRVPTNTAGKIPLSVDTDAVRAARALLDRIAVAAQVESSPTIADILTFSEVLVKNEVMEGMDHLVPVVKEAVMAALSSLSAARRREGAILELDMLTRCAEITRVLAEIERRAPDRVAKEQERLQSRIDEMTRGLSNVDARGIEQEIAFFADRVDITEEIVRLKSHVQLFELTFAGVAEPIGQRLLFLLQEMHREASTISSKANDAAIAQMSVLVKQEIEKIREQVQNLC